MSHYCVAVFANHPREFETLLAPYDETNEAYYEYEPISEPSDHLKQRYDEMKEKNWLEDISFDEWLTDLGYRIIDGKICVWRNPQGKWDWYTLDGKSWMFDLKDGEEYDDEGYTRKNQYNYINTDTNKEECAEYWHERLREAAEAEDQKARQRAEYFLREFPTKEQYIRQMINLHPYAFITPDGVWHAPGNVGWFAISDDTPETCEQYMNEWLDYISSEENPYVSFVDCHI